MDEKVSNIYHPGMTPAKLADNVLKIAYGDGVPTIPIDPFNLMKKFGIIYQFMEFKDIEGIYIVPKNEEDVPFVGISHKRKITRQRFTAAHELCHHIKDRKSKACPIGSSSDIEQYAEKFAAELLMPRGVFQSVAQEYACKRIFGRGHENSSPDYADSPLS